LRAVQSRGNKSPAPPEWTAPRGAVLNRKRATPLIKCERKSRRLPKTLEPDY